MYFISSRFLLLTLLFLGMPSISLAQAEPDRITYEQEKELKTMLAELLKAKPGSNPLNLTDAALKRQFDLAGRTEQYNLLRLNKSMMEKKYEHEGDFVGYYMSRFNKLFDEKIKNTWVLAYTAQNKTEKSFWDKLYAKTGLKGDKKNTVTLSYYHLLYPAERVYYVELVVLVYQKGEADFSTINKRAKDWVALHNEMFP